MRTRSVWWRLLAVMCAFALVASACGDDDDDGGTAATEDDGGEPAASDDGDGEAETDDGEAAADDGEAGDDGEMAADGGEMAEGVVEFASGTSVDLSECPEDWSDTAGITDDEIRLAVSLPQSGALASFGAIAEGMQAYFDSINESDPIDGRNVVLVARDDAYDAARTQTNVEEMLETENIFAFNWIIGSANNGQVRPIFAAECVPQLFNATGLPAWGDPANFPWTTGGLISYDTEANIWCNHIAEELGEGATVAGLFQNNDFGAAYQSVLEACDEAGTIELVENLVHEATAADITNEMTTLAASGADAFVLGSTGAFCPQSMAAVAQSPWSPLFLMSSTCENTAAFFAPVDPAGAGVRMALNNKGVTDAAFADDPGVQDAIAVLEAAGLDPFGGSVSTGVLFALATENLLREAAAMDGGLTRTNLMKAAWNMDFTNPLLRDGINQITSGVDDAYSIEGAVIAEYVPPAEEGSLGSFETLSDLISVEGETGSFGG